MTPITRAQRLALKAIYDRGPLTPTKRWDYPNPYTSAVTAGAADPIMTYREFRKLVRGPFYISDPVLMVPWCGMWLGVEPDGYTHS